MSHELDWQNGASDYPNQGQAGAPGGHDDLEAGIAAVFAAIRDSGVGFDGEADPGAETAVEDDGATFALLGELNRLWQQSPH